MRDSTHELEPDDPSPDGEAVAWDMEAEVVCPYCGEAVSIGLDPGGGAVQTYVEDCPVCCQPWQVFLHYGGDGAAAVELDTA
jgi:hypothetical protein